MSTTTIKLPAAPAQEAPATLTARPLTADELRQVGGGIMLLPAVQKIR